MTGPAEASERPRVVLVGPPGSGKSTVGKLLARRWQVGFRDTDRDVEQDTGSSISEIFVQDGERRFRDLERAAVEAALSTHRGVLALGGGAVMDPRTREALRDQVVVHLDVGLAAAMRRLEMNRSRPLLMGNVRGRWQQLADERRPLYLEVATVSVLTDDLGVEQVCDTIAEALEEGSGRGD